MRVATITDQTTSEILNSKLRTELEGDLMYRCEATYCLSSMNLYFWSPVWKPSWMTIEFVSDDSATCETSMKVAYIRSQSPTR